ncbi:hypothetical protein ONZ45_g13580 [Pleurotus djamor]|nr:hypothetical protein ONZ45_g13580 [Pleurotus djamor]
MSSSLSSLSEDEPDENSFRLTLVVPASRHQQSFHMTFHRSPSRTTPSLPSAPSTPRGHCDRRRPRTHGSHTSVPTSAFYTPRSPPSPPLSDVTDIRSPAVDDLVAQLAALEVRPLDDVPYVPLHLREAGDRRRRQNWRVPDDIRAIYPPVRSFRPIERWYVVARGYETGIVYDTWTNVCPLTVFPGGYTPAFDEYELAAAHWRECERNRSITRVRREN